MRDERERLLDVHEAIERIEKYAAQGRASFDRDELVQTWIVHHLLIIGEACRAIPRQFRDRHPGIPWAEIVQMRNILVHRYFGIDKDAVWQVVQRDLPDLKGKIEQVLRTAGGSENRFR